MGDVGGDVGADGNNTDNNNVDASNRDTPRGDAGGGCALVDNRCNRLDDNCDGEIDELCCPAGGDWFNTGPGGGELRPLSPRVTWSAHANKFLLAWIVTTRERDAANLATAPVGELRFAIFDFEYRPTGIPASFLDMNVTQFDVTEIDGEFFVIYAHANTQGSTANLVSVAKIDAEDAIPNQRTQVTNTDGTVEYVGASQSDSREFMALWTEEDTGSGSGCSQTRASCILTMVLESSLRVEDAVQADITLGKYYGVDLAMGPSGGIIMAVVQAQDPEPSKVVWKTVTANFNIDGNRGTVNINGAAELNDTAVDPGLRVATLANGNFAGVRTTGRPSRVLSHVISPNGQFLDTIELDRDTGGLRDVSLATVKDPQQSVVTAWPTDGGVMFKLWNSGFDMAVRTHLHMPRHNEFDYRPVDIATAPGVGYVVALSAPGQNGEEVYFTFLGPELDRLCGRPQN